MLYEVITLSGRGGLVFGVGGFICYFFLGPLLMAFGQKDGPHAIAEIPPLRGWTRSAGSIRRA